MPDNPGKGASLKFFILCDDWFVFTRYGSALNSTWVISDDDYDDDDEGNWHLIVNLRQLRKTYEKMMYSGC